MISPWVDLTHSFPSITIPTDFDYVPAHGFHAKPSLAWPPPTSEEMKFLNWPKHKGAAPDYVMDVDGERVVLKEQFQMYAENNHLQCPLVSSVVAASLGGLCPLQVIVGGGEVLRDEQIYLAHKAADPEQYPPADDILARNCNTWEDVMRYPPTNVQLLVFDDGPHAAPTIGHTRIAKYEYRAVAQFAAWALSNAQMADVDIQDDSSLYSSHTGEPAHAVRFYSSPLSFLQTLTNQSVDKGSGEVGKVGDPIPPFVDHMVRQRVDRFGRLFPLKLASELRACVFPREEIGIPKQSALEGWHVHREKDDIRWARQKREGT